MLVIVEPLEEDYIITCSRTRGFILGQIGSTSCISTKTIDDNNNKTPYIRKMRTKLRKGNSHKLLKEMLTLARCEGRSQYTTTFLLQTSQLFIKLESYSSP